MNILQELQTLVGNVARAITRRQPDNGNASADPAAIARAHEARKAREERISSGAIPEYGEPEWAAEARVRKLQLNARIAASMPRPRN